MSLADYLAKNYLTADSKPEKKSKKRKRKDAADGLIIADDDDLGWSTSKTTQGDDDGPVTCSRSQDYSRIFPLITYSGS
jgi:pre-mRNA-splicing factor CWC26